MVSRYPVCNVYKHHIDDTSSLTHQALFGQGAGRVRRVGGYVSHFPWLGGSWAYGIPTGTRKYERDAGQRV